MAEALDKVANEGLNIYATTASRPNELSYAWYHDNYRDTYLADQYSVVWMLDSQKKMESGETLHKQFRDVAKAVNKSHPQDYGSKTRKGIAGQQVDTFQGEEAFTTDLMPETLVISNDLVSARESYVEGLRRRWARACDTMADGCLDVKKDVAALLNRELIRRQMIGDVFKQIAMKATSTYPFEFWKTSKPTLTKFDGMR